jgi:molybdenum cofactor cytidylyltransferase
MSTDFKINNCAAILLAAGASVRLGQPKQLLTYHGKTFIQNMISAAVSAKLHPVVVVLGAHSDLISGEIKNNNIHLAHNNDWEEGIASSIRCGIKTLQKIDAACDAAILIVCDQPYIKASLLDDLVVSQGKTGAPIAAAYYNGVAGTPALFHKKIFSDLLLLRGDKGAQKILRQFADRITTVPFPMGIIDIDTKDHYEKLRQNTK